WAERAVVVTTDGNHRDRVAVPAPQAPQRLLKRLSHRVPDGAVRARAGHEAEPPISEDVERRRPGQLPAPLLCKRDLTDQGRSDVKERAFSSLTCGPRTVPVSFPD